MALLNEIKLVLRISNTAMDTEILDLIESAKMDLKISGINIDKTVIVDEVEEMDPLIKRAITLYCKGHFGYDNPDAERFIRSYQALSNHLALSTDYQMVVIPIV